MRSKLQVSSVVVTNERGDKVSKRSYIAFQVMFRTSSRSALAPIECRDDLKRCRRVVIKAGTSVVTNDDGHFSLTRVSAIVEQISELRQAGVEVILVTSGAVGCGRMRLRKQAILSTNFQQQLRMAGTGAPGLSAAETQGYSSACASAGI